ncbi:MAG TPA: response regulator [Acidimicrobiales bacterium]|nr:response regulator [Acidimicrobiales bacterium]
MTYDGAGAPVAAGSLGEDDRTDPAVRSLVDAAIAADAGTDCPAPAEAAGTRHPGPLRSDVRAFVLVVDDEADVRDSMAGILRASGFAVAAVADGRDAARVLEELVVDVMVLDVRMPRLGGLELLEMLEEPPVAVIVSADPVDPPVRERLGTKVRAYLRKPYDPRDLVAAVEGSTPA